MSYDGTTSQDGGEVAQLPARRATQDTWHSFPLFAQRTPRYRHWRPSPKTQLQHYVKTHKRKQLQVHLLTAFATRVCFP